MVKRALMALSLAGTCSSWTSGNTTYSSGSIGGYSDQHSSIYDW